VANIPKILAPIDGSDRSMNTIAYLGKTLSARSVAIELFHVLPETPEPFLDLGELHESVDLETEIGKWKGSRRRHIVRFLEKAKTTLLDSGFSSGSISTTIQPCQEGIARDLINRSANGYAAVIMGRNGFGTLPDFVLGSIAAKLADTLHHVPLAIVGGQPDTAKVVVAFDKSRRIRQGLDAVGKILSPQFEEIMLCHISRPLTEVHTVQKPYFDSRYAANWLDENQRKVIAGMVEAKQRLSSAGFDPKSFHTAIIKEKTSRADGIICEAKAMNAGTIIVGRRGITSVETFSMGRVTRKILTLGFDRAIWIV
jgi:nucleotide-binding universal stress UspA family protein